MKRLKKNNKGFSLVELIAAVAILAVVVTPLLHSFVTSTTVSSRATQISETTLAGKNILEAVDARPISEWQQISDTNLASELLSSSVSTASITPIGKYNYLGNLETEESDGGFEIGIQNIKAGNALYDAKVEFSRGDKELTYTNSEGNTVPSTSNGLYIINDKEIAKYSSMDGVFCQSYINTANPDVLVDEAYETKSKIDATFSKNYLYKERQITLEAYKDDSGLIWATLTYTYQFTYDELDKNDGIKTGRQLKWPLSISADSAGHSDVTFTYSLFPGGFEPVNKDGSVSIYMMYYPVNSELFKNVPGTTSACKDKIRFYNIAPDGYEVDLRIFLYKQNPLKYNNTSHKYEMIDTTGQRYQADVTMWMPDGFEIDNEDDDAKRKTLVYTNANKGMLHESDLDFAVGNASYESFDPNFYNPDIYDPDDPSTWVPKIQHFFTNNQYADTYSLVRKENEIRIYNVKVTLYPKGSFVPNKETYSTEIGGRTYSIVDTTGSSFTGDPIYTIEGTKTP